MFSERTLKLRVDGLLCQFLDTKWSYLLTYTDHYNVANYSLSQDSVCLSWNVTFGKQCYKFAAVS